MNIIFYSQQCSTCRDLLILLRNENLLNYFTLFCVDNRLDKIPKQITRVPTMIVSNINKPLIAQETFEWVNQIKFLKNNSNANNVDQNKLSGGPKGFSENEMIGLSDKFSFTDKDKPLQQSYFGVGDEAKHAIYTAPSDDPITKDEQMLLIHNLEISREYDDKQSQIQRQNNILQLYN